MSFFPGRVWCRANWGCGTAETAGLLLFQDDEDGEISYSFTMAILEEDLPSMRRR